MPIFEFTCDDCATGRKFSVLIGVVADPAPPVCPRCGSTNVRKCVSRFARVRSEDSRLDDLADAADRLDENDPKAIRSFMKEMASGMDGEVSTDELEAMLDEAESGGDDGAGGDAAAADEE